MSETDSYTDSFRKDLSKTRPKSTTYSVSFCDSSFENFGSPLLNNGSKEDLIDPNVFEDDAETIIRNRELYSSQPASSPNFEKCSR